MHISIFLTYGNSLETWDQAGLISRELRIFQYLQKNHGVKFTFYTYGDNNEMKFSSEYPEFEIVPIYSKLKLSRFKSINLLKSFLIPFLLRSSVKKTDIIYQNQLFGSWVTIFLKLLTRKPLFVRTGYNIYEFAILDKKTRAKIYLYKILTKFTLNSAEIFSVTSNQDLQFIKKNFPNYKCNLILRQNWVDIKEVNKNFDYSKKIGSNKILSVGRLENQKNYTTLLNLLKNSKDEYKLEIIGNGSMENSLLKLAKLNSVNLKINKNVDHGELIKIFNKYQFYISCSLHEGNPKTILEAMAAGCIVIASKIESHKELISNGLDGFLIDLNETDLLELLNKINTDIEKEEISINARNKIKNNYSLEKIASLFFNDFDKMMKV